MMIKKTGVVLGILWLGLTSCKKDVVLPPTAGTFKGTFARIFDEDDTIGFGNVSISLQEADLKYQCSVDTASSVPVSCAGSYFLIGTDEIVFERASNVALPEDDPYLILDTSYTYFFNDTSFNFDFTADEVRYSYRLQRF